MPFPGARLIDLDEARRLLEPHLDADCLDLDLSLAEPTTTGGILLLPDGAVVDGDLALDPEQARFNGAELRGIIASGRLTVRGDITSAGWDGGSFLVVLGDAEVRHIIKRASPTVFVGPVFANGSIYCQYNHGSFRAHAGVKAQAFINDDHYCEVAGAIDAIVFSTRYDDPRLYLLAPYYYEEEDGEPYLIDGAADAMIAAIRSGAPIFRLDAPRRSAL